MLNNEAVTGQAATPVGRIASFGKYLLLQRVSVGGMAEVFKAIPEGATAIDQIVAIKRILPNIAEDREFIGMFIDEARIAGQLTHPNICRIYELGRVGADHYIAMQFLWGRDLLKVMNRFKRAGLLIPPAMAAFTAMHACAALHYAHNKRDQYGQPLNIIHRDVSPQNIIVGYSGQAKLIDFGVARAATQSQKTQAGILKGKFGYMSPEMIRGLPVDHRSDVFAMGICLHEALTGSRLFYGETDFATLELVRDARIVPPSAKVPGLPPALDEIVLKALSRDANLRYQSAEEMQYALQGFLASHFPGYGENEVSACMREAFGHELTREKLRLDTFSQMLQRGELVRNAVLPALPAEPPPSGERPMSAEELALTRVPTKQSQLTDEEVRRLSGEHDLNDEQTQIFFSSAELNELREMDEQPELEPEPVRIPSVSDVVLRGSNGLPGAALMPAPSFPKLTPSGTYQRSFDESARAYTPGRAAHPRDERGIQTQTIPAYNGPNPFSEPPTTGLSAPQPHRGLLRTSLLAAAAIALAGLGYTAVRLGTHRKATLEIAGVGDPDAVLRVDGVVRGNPPLTVDDLEPGLHSLELEARGFETARADVHLESGETHPVRLVLSAKVSEAPEVPAQANPAPATGAPTSPAEPVQAAPVQAPAPTVQAPRTTPAQGTNVAAAPAPDAAPKPLRPMGGKLRGATPVVREEEAPAPGGGETQVSGHFNDEAAAAGEGELLISTTPWSRVIIDGNDTGRDTPVRALRVPQGAHTVTLRVPDGEDHDIQINVEPGKLIRIIRHF